MKGRNSCLTGSHTGPHYTPTLSDLLHSKNEWKVGAVILQAVAQIHTTLPHLQLSCTARVEGRNIAVTGPHDTPTPCGNVTPQQEWKAETLQSQVHTTLPHHVGMWHHSKSGRQKHCSHRSTRHSHTMWECDTTARVEGRNIAVTGPHDTPTPCGNVTPQQEWKAETLQSQVHTTLPHHVGMWHHSKSGRQKHCSHRSTRHSHTMWECDTTARVEGRNIAVTGPHNTPTPCGNVTPQQEWKAETLQSQVHTTLPHHVGMWHLQPTSTVTGPHDTPTPCGNVTPSAHQHSHRFTRHSHTMWECDTFSPPAQSQVHTTLPHHVGMWHLQPTSTARMESRYSSLIGDHTTLHAFRPPAQQKWKVGIVESYR